MDTKATTNLEQSDARAMIDSLLESSGISLEALAVEIGYASRTLRGVRYGEIPLSAKLERALRAWVERSPKNVPKIGEDVPFFGGAETREIAGHEVRVFHPIARGKKPEHTPATDLTAPFDNKGDNATAQLMIELLQDFQQASGVKRQWLAGQIRDMARSLGATETTPFRDR